MVCSRMGAYLLAGRCADEHAAVAGSPRLNVLTVNTWLRWVCVSCASGPANSSSVSRPARQSRSPTAVGPSPWWLSWRWRIRPGAHSDAGGRSTLETKLSTPRRRQAKTAKPSSDRWYCRPGSRRPRCRIDTDNDWIGARRLADGARISQRGFPAESIIHGATFPASRAPIRL